MSDLEAYSVLCQQHGIDTSKYLTSEEAKYVRDAFQKVITDKTKSKDKNSGNTFMHRDYSEKIKRRLEKANLKDPLLPPTTIDESIHMAQIYAKLYVFENSLRLFTTKVMEKKYGRDWWNLINSPKFLKMKSGADSRIADEKRNAWHGKRGVHPINYTDLKDFYDFIDENWPLFKSYFPSKDWLLTRLGEISRSRNCVDHHNLLRSIDITRLDVYFEDWFNQLNSIKENFREER